ncbi:MAG: N-acetyltransferase [Actinomycetota bacterium]|nr:N-acetyltransferase [Actinomycetota bacterium]
MVSQIDPRAQVEPGVRLGEGTAVWAGAHVRAGASLGVACVVGDGAFIDSGVTVGDRCKIQNGAQLFAPASLGNGVFVGPGVVLTNDRAPRAVEPDGSLRQRNNWLAEGVVVEEGASLGARVTVLAGVRIGAWCMVGAGAVVTRNVPPFALVTGVPARQVGWVGRAGLSLLPAPDALVCPATGRRYEERDGLLRELP